MSTRERAPLGRWLIAITALAGLLQLGRLPWRVGQISFAYAAYVAEQRRIIHSDGYEHAITTFLGLHPPAWTLFFLGLIGISAPVIVWHLSSALFSIAAVPTLGLAGQEDGAEGDARAVLVGPLLAAALFATAPGKLAYGLEVNNYPLLLLCSSLQLWAFTRWSRQPGERHRGLWLAAATVAACWTHLLAILLPAAQLAALLLAGRASQCGPLRHFARPMGLAALGCLPLLPGIWGVLGAEGINQAVPAGAVARHILGVVPGRYGPSLLAWTLAGICGVAALVAWRHAPARRLLPLSWALHLGLALLVIATLVQRGIAARNQLSYFLVLLPTACLLAGWLAGRAGRLGRGVRWLLLARVAGCLLLGLSAILVGARRWTADPPLDPLARAALLTHWTAGSSLLLVQLPSHGDDDKDHLDAVYASVPIWSPVRWEDPEIPGLTPSDPYVGQPVKLDRDRWLFTLTTFDPRWYAPIIDTVLSRGQRVVVVNYDRGKRPGDEERLRRWMVARYGEPTARSERELLWVMEGAR